MSVETLTQGLCRPESNDLRSVKYGCLEVISRTMISHAGTPNTQT